MGIKKLKELIKQRAPEALVQIPLADLAGKRIAIDGNNWVLLNLAVQRKNYLETINLMVEDFDPMVVRNLCLTQLLNLLLDWVEQDIFPVVVFDGVAPPEKAATREQRRALSRKQKEDIEMLTEKIHTMTFPDGDTIDSLQKALKNCNFLAYNDMKFIQTTIEQLGFPVLYAINEAEKLCSALCIEGKVAAVFSTDTDTLAHGAPLMLTGTNNRVYDEDGYRIRTFEGIRLDYVLSGLGLTQSMFVDFCIMCGCDYNENIRGYAIKRSYALIKQFGYINDLPKEIDSAVLRFPQCRVLFSYQVSDKLTEKMPPLTLTPNYDQVHGILDQIGAASLLSRLVSAWKKEMSITNGHPEKLALATAYKYSHRPRINVVK